MTPRARRLAFCFITAPWACSPADEGGPPEEVERRASAGVTTNGLKINGTSLNGLKVNGTSLNGLKVNGASLNGVSLVGSELRGVAPDGSPIGGAGFAGVEAQALLSDASTLTLRIDGVRSSGDLWFYKVSYPTASGPKPLCGLDAAGAPIEAIALAGRWNLAEGVPGGGSWIDDPAMFTFGCRDAALAKCVELGYKPWAAAGGTSLRNHHQACTRLIRADYCGNGQPGTLDGWQINLYDALGVQADTESGAAWVFEGKWGPAGAACVDEYRLLELVASGPVPDCALAKLTGVCAAGGFAGGVLLQSEYNSAGLIELVRDIVNGSPNAKLADKVEDALAELEVAFAALAESPPDRLAAVGKLEGAVGDLKVTIGEGTLPPGYGNGLANRITGVARFQATATIDANACGAKKPSELLKAKLLRAEGDKRRSTGDYKGACGKYKGAVDKAEKALGSPCAP